MELHGTKIIFARSVKQFGEFDVFVAKKITDYAFFLNSAYNLRSM